MPSIRDMVNEARVHMYLEQGHEAMAYHVAAGHDNRPEIEVIVEKVLVRIRPLLSS